MFTKATDGCPKPGEGHRFVGADLDGNGTVDATAPELTDCFSPVGCEAFAAPDVNGDGTSEIAVSTAGADGYGVWLYAVTTSPAAVEPIAVVDPQGIGNVQTGTLQFAWVDVVGHSGGARCDTLPNGSTFSIFGVDKIDPQRRRPVHGSARSTGATRDRRGRLARQGPDRRRSRSGNSLCGAPLYGSASNFPNAAPDPKTMTSGSDEPLCDVSTLEADFTGEGKQDTAWVGSFGTERPVHHAADTSAEIVPWTDGRWACRWRLHTLNAGCLICRAYAAADLNADGSE